MMLEINLVKTYGIGPTDGKFIERLRVDVNSDSAALDQIVSFIQNNISEFTARLSDQRFVSRLETLKSLTINDFFCLKYILQLNGMDIWAFYVADVETNKVEVPADSVEFNIIDMNTINGSFLPMATKITQLKNNLKVEKVFSQMINMYGLFKSPLFEGLNIPLNRAINSLDATSDGASVKSESALAVCNVSFNALNKQRYIIRN